MKKFLSILIIFIFTMLFIPVFADIIPLSSKSIKHYGIGLLNMPNSYTVYQYPYNDAKVIREVNYESLKKSAMVNTIDMRKVSYVAHIPEKDIALLTVDLNPGNNWYCVFLNQETGETGWVYHPNTEDFYTYRQLFYKYGKKYGIRFFSDLKEDDKALYAKPTETSQLLATVKYPKYISYTIIHGNWLLGNVNDMGKTSKIGWIRWRNSDGTLNMFPNFKE